MSSEADANVTKRRGRPKKDQTRSFIEPIDAEVDVAPKTPLRRTVATTMELQKTPLSALTPSRRSARKSIKPAQDYEEIILKKSTLNSHNGELENVANEEQKWTPAKVGRVSQKRSTRKGRSGKKSVVAKILEVQDDRHSFTDGENKCDEPDDIVEAAEVAIINSLDDGENTSDEPDDIVEAAEVAIINSLDDGENTSDEPGDIVEATEEAIKDTLNATFDKDSEENVEVQNESIAIEKREVLPTKEEGKAKSNDADEIEVQGSIAVDNIVKNKSDVPDGIVEATEGAIKDTLNATFDKDSEENVEVQNESIAIEMRKVLPTKKEGEAKSNDADELEVKGSIAVDNIVRKEITIHSAVLKMLSEDNELGCTPILYEDSSEAEKEARKGGKENVNEGQLKEPEVYEAIDLASDDEMPCLVLSDDEDHNEKKDDDKDSANDTFNMSDCIVISPVEVSACQNKLPEKESEPKQSEKISSLAAAEKKVKELQENYFSPTQKPVPKVVLTTEKNASETLLPTPRLGKKRQNLNTPVSMGKRQNIATPVLLGKRQIVGTPVSTNKRQFGGTPASTSKGAMKQTKVYRFPTPYKSKKDFRFGDENKIDKENDDQSVREPQVVLTTLEPREIVLRSIRKRSLSVTIDGDQRKRRPLNVTFYSPANQTASIADLDEKLAKSVAKTVSQNANQPEKVIRRKRSISLDDNYLRQQPSKLPRPVRNSPQNTKATKRTRLPNFAAIHQQQFQKMENLVDYVARKAERSKNLTNSALKARNAAVPSPAAKKDKPNASKSLILTSNNKDISNAGKLFVLTPNKNNFSSVGKTNKSVLEKLNQRTKRHMDMFKECPVDSMRATRKNTDIIRGVRSNRRFELMMQHRKTSGN